MTQPNNGQGYAGFQIPGDGSNDFNAVSFLVHQILAKIPGAALVKVLATTNSGTVVPVGFVDVQVMVNQIDGNMNGFPNVIIHRIPVFRLQGGGNAVILDPQVNDIGLAIFADRDISNVVATRDIANPASLRKNSYSDGVYLGGFLNGTPTQYIEFSATGIKIHSPTLINLEAPDVQLNATTIELNASTSITMTSPEIAMTASTSILATTPIFTMTGNLLVEGSITGETGMSITGTYP